MCDSSAGGGCGHAGQDGGGDQRSCRSRGPHHQRRDGELRAGRVHRESPGVHQAAV